MIVQHINFLDKNKRICCRKYKKVVNIDKNFLNSECINNCSYYKKYEYMEKQELNKIICSWDDFFQYKYEVVGVYNPDLELRRINGEPTENEVVKNNNKYISEKLKYYINTKEAHLLNPIVEKVKNCDKCVRRDEKRKACLINPFQTFAKLEYLKPYTTNYWTDQCFNYPADIAILGQDWGSAASVISYNEKDRNELSNETRGNLEEGISKTIKCKNRAVYINSVMCLREGNDTDNECFDKKFIRFCKDNIIDHLNIVKPKIVITMGKEVSQTYIESIKSTEPVYKFASKPYYDVNNGWFIFPIYHLGKKAQLSRNLNKNKSNLIIGDFLKDFELVKWLLISYYLGQILMRSNGLISNIENELIKSLPELSNEIENLFSKKINFSEFKLNQDLSELILRLYIELTNKFVYNYPLKMDSLKTTTYAKSNVLYNNSKIIKTLHTNEVYWFMNVGEKNGKFKERYWEDNAKFGFISLGHGDININLLEKVDVGNYIFAYISKCGYIGYGKVRSKAVMYKDSNLYKKVVNKQINLKNEHFMKEKIDDIYNCEYIIEIDWLKKLDKTNPIPGGTLYVSPSTFCELHKSKTITELIYEFRLR